MYKLIIEDDEGKTTVVPLIRDEITIGRKEGNTIRLTERNVSRKHAKLTKANGAIYIEDQQSFNGIKVNGERISGRAPITEGDRVQIGDYQLALKLDRTVPEAGPAAGEEKTTPYIKDESRATAMVEAPRIPAAPAPAASGAGAAPAASGAEPPARLVVVSSNFAGKEFKLDKKEMVIGRTSDNDVVLDHRSISRHHAKILKENGRYQVQDLGSANGVRVNGEEYGKVELRKGDLIDLGHVRLRFIAPTEDFVFARDAKVVDVEETQGKGGGKGGKGLLIAGVLGGLVLVGGIIAVVAMKGGGGGEGEKGAATSGSTAEANMAVDKAMKALDWDGAIVEADKGLKIDARDELLKDKKAKAETEQKNKLVFEAYDKAKASDPETAVMKYQEIPDNSVYHDKAGESWPLVKKAYLADHLGQARTLSSTNRCDDAKKHVEAVLLVDEANSEAQEIARKCGQPTPAPRVKPSSGSSSRPSKPDKPDKPDRPAVVEKAPDPPKAVTPPPTEPKPPAAGGEDADKFLAQAQDAYVRGDHRGAVDLARKALKISPNNPKAWRIAGAASCFLKDEAEARKAWNHLTRIDRQFLQYVCDKNAIRLMP